MLLYRILSTLALILYSPFALLRSTLGRRRLGDLRGRLGNGSYPDLDGGIWVHAVSVGEVGVARNLLAALASRFPGHRLGLSVTTEAGSRLARSVAGDDVPVFPYPFDLETPVEKALSRVRPGLVLLTETEIWPLFLERAAARGVTVALVNGRVSRRSFGRYGLVRRWLAASLRRVALFAMQSEEDARRIVVLGAPADRVRMTGNIKYDLPDAPEFGDAARLREAAGGRPVFTAASTAEGEERIVLAAWRRLSSRPLLALAPRRPERFDAVAGLVEQAGFRVLRRSSREPGRPDPDAVYLLDSIGELASLYRETQVAFIGGSLLPGGGGHNPIEAWAAGVPVLVGPHTENFRQILEDGRESGVAWRVEDGEGLARELARLFSDPRSARESGERARRLVAENRGAAERTVDLLQPLLEPARRRRAAP